MIGNILSALVCVSTHSVLRATFRGELISPYSWIKSTTFASYMLSRVIGGLSEGNVQLAMYVIFQQHDLRQLCAHLGFLLKKSAILSDITTPANRAKALAHVGIAFAICFCIGPPIGAYFASRPVMFGQTKLGGAELNVYAAPAILT